MTDIEILEETKMHWKHMRDNEPTDKTCYGPAGYWRSNCFLCEASNGYCHDCAMRGSWGEVRQPPVRNCQDAPSMYRTWEWDKSKESCQGMVDALQRKIDSLRAKEKKKKKKKCKCQPFNPQPNPLCLCIGDAFLVRHGEDAWVKRVFLGYVRDDESGGELWIAKDVTSKGIPMHWSDAKPVPKTKTVVKSAIAIMESLLSTGYAVNNFGHWVKRGVAFFDTDMWIYCGKEPNTNWDWKPEWLEEVTI